MVCPLFHKCRMYGVNCSTRDFLECYLHISIVLDKYERTHFKYIPWELKDQGKRYYADYCLKHYGRARKIDLEG